MAKLIGLTILTREFAGLMLDIPWKTYRNWEDGRRFPNELTRSELFRRMEYIENYLREKLDHDPKLNKLLQQAREQYALQATTPQSPNGDSDGEWISKMCQQEKHLRCFSKKCQCTCGHQDA